MDQARCARCGAELDVDSACSACRPRDPSSGLLVAGSLEPRSRAFDDARAWCRGRSGWVRLPLLVWFTWILVHHLRDPDYQSLFGGLNLGIHELGHFVFGLLGEFPGIAGGTVLQLAAPAIAAAIFWRQRDRFAIAVAACWLSTNLFNVARYAGDARAQLLPLVSPTSGDPIHDWHFMLGRLGMLKWDSTLAAGLRSMAVVSMLAGLGAATWLVWQMLQRRPGEARSHEGEREPQHRG